MYEILADMQRALDARAAYAALATAVTLPEICSRCELRDMFATTGPAQGKRMFQSFAQRYLSGWAIGLTGDDLYYLRNGLSHRGQLKQRQPSVRYVFTPLVGSGFVAHGNVGLNNEGREGVVLNIDLRQFCHDIAAAVTRWLVDHADNEQVQRNLRDVIQPREDLCGTGIKIEGMKWLA